MKTKLIWSVLAFAMTSLLPLASAQASFLDDLTGNNAGYAQTYTYNVTHSGQLQNSVPGAYTPAQAPPRVAYQQPILQAQELPQQRATPKAAVKKKANRVRSVKAQPANRRQPRAVARTYQQSYPAQPRPAIQPGYGQTQANYYANQYQTQYTAAPNYYQGYYGAWGSSAQACPPGRA